MAPSLHTAPLRIALAGLGGHGQTLQEAVAHVPDLSVVAVLDPDDAAAEAAAGRFGCPCATDFDALLFEAAPEAVVIATPNAFHEAQARSAMAAGCDVFVEKPMALTAAAAQALVAQAEAQGRILMVGHNMRYAPAVNEARRLLDENAIGTLVTVEVHFSSDTALHLGASSWRRDPAACPLPPVTQLGLHGLDLVHALLGPITAVYAQARTAAGTGMVDSVVAAFEVEGGVLGTLVCNYCTHIRFEIHLSGTAGSLHLTPHRLAWHRTADTDALGDAPLAAAFDFSDRPYASYLGMMQAFAAALRTRRPPDADGQAGLRAVAVVEALATSLSTRAPVDVAHPRHA